MSSPDYADYRDGIISIRKLTQQARQVAAAMVDDGLPARNVRKKLYDAIGALNMAAEYVDIDLINLDQTDKDLM
jgi:hypothetical protein